MGIRGGREWLDEVERIDVAVYRAIAVTPTPASDASCERGASVANPTPRPPLELVA